MDENEVAYLQAQDQLKEWQEGYIPFDKIFTTEKQVMAFFSRLVDGSILNWLGTQFFWRRAPGGALVIYAKNDDIQELKDRGLVEICRFRNLPDAWIGVGRFRIIWPELKNQKTGMLFLINLYLFSTDADDLVQLIENDYANAAYLATIFLGEENAELFNQLAEERFESLW